MTPALVTHDLLYFRHTTSMQMLYQDVNGTAAEGLRHERLQCSKMQGMTSESCPVCERSHWFNPGQRSRDMSEVSLPLIFFNFFVHL